MNKDLIPTIIYSIIYDVIKKADKCSTLFQNYVITSGSPQKGRPVIVYILLLF